jgi:hypothetical protein
MRTTVHPFLRRSRFCLRSRRLFVSILAFHHSRRVAGIRHKRGCPCQNSPSKKTAMRSRRNKISGRTMHEEPRTRNLSFCPRRQPVMSSSRRSATITSSVSLFPADRIADITSDRLLLVKTSATRGGSFLRCEKEPSVGFVLRVMEHPVVKPGPLRIAGVKLIIGKFPRFRPPPRLGGKPSQRTRPPASLVFVSVGMQPGKQVGHGAPCAEEIWLGQLIDFQAERDAEFPPRAKQRIWNRDTSVHVLTTTRPLCSCQERT